MTECGRHARTMRGYRLRSNEVLNDAMPAGAKGMFGSAESHHRCTGELSVYIQPESAEEMEAHKKNNLGRQSMGRFMRSSSWG